MAERKNSLFDSAATGQREQPAPDVIRPAAASSGKHIGNGGSGAFRRLLEYFVYTVATAEVSRRTLQTRNAALAASLK